MTFEETFLMIERIVHLARARATGTPDELVKKLGVDRRTLYRIIEKARRIGVHLEYSRTLSSFILLPHELQEISSDDLKRIKCTGHKENNDNTNHCILF